MSQQFGQRTDRTESVDKRDQHERAPGHPFHGMTEAEIQQRLGDSPTRGDTDVDADTDDAAGDAPDWRELWDSVDAVVSPSTCEVLSLTQVQTLADVYDKPTPTVGGWPDELELVTTENDVPRGFVLSGLTPIVDVPDVSADISASDRWDTPPEDEHE